MNKMLFKLECIAQGYLLVKGQRLDVNCGEQGHIAVSIWGSEDENDLDGYAVCEATASFELATHLQHMLAAIAACRLPAGFRQSDPPDDLVDADGTFQDGYMPPWSMFPAILESRLTEIRDELLAGIQQVLGLYRWRYGMDSDVADPFRHPHFHLHWSEDGQNWNHTMPRLTGELGFAAIHRVFDRIRDFTIEEAARGTLPPLSRDLLREAAQHIESNPRSAVVLAIAAAEVGFKQCVAQLVPDARYLIDRVQLLPLADMMKNFLPQLPAKCTVNGQVLAAPKTIRSTINTGIKTRNKIVYRPYHDAETRDQLRPENVSALVDAVSALLWILDFYRGYEWAADQLDDKVREEWEAQASS